MDFIKLDLNYHKQLLDLEGEMYWTEGKWKVLWDSEAKDKFDDLITDYLTNFPEGCFGLIENNVLVGAMFLLKINKLEPIPYVNKVDEYLIKDGEVAYVTFFVVKKGTNDKEIAEELYLLAKIVAKELLCKKLAVTINVSPLEEKILQEQGFEKLETKFEWEIYPETMVPASIYFCEI